MGLNRRRKRLRNLCPEEVRDSDDYKTLVECFDKSFTIEPPYVAIREPQIGELFVPLLNNVEHKIVKELDYENEHFSARAKLSKKTQFNYTDTVIVAPSFLSYILKTHKPNEMPQCSCEDGLCLPESCTCIIIGAGITPQPPYIDGCLNLDQGKRIHECVPEQCSCIQGFCSNMRTQSSPVPGIAETFMKSKEYYAVRARRDIEAGTYIMEYTGELLPDEIADIRSHFYDRNGLSYMFDCHLDADILSGDTVTAVDAYQYGNESRFFNHCCTPNMEVFSIFPSIVRVVPELDEVWAEVRDKGISVQELIDKPCANVSYFPRRLVPSIDIEKYPRTAVFDYRLKRLCFFAKRDIKAGEELTFDYDYHFDTLPVGVKNIKCRCGSSKCRGFLYSVGDQK